MENIGFGIMCFGDDKYFKGATNILTNLIDQGHRCYVLTDNEEYFFKRYWGRVEIIPYKRIYKSFYDKISLVKIIHQKHDICILLDADLYIKDYDLFNKLINFDFKKGVSYIDTLWNHSAKFKTVGDIPMEGDEWSEFKKYSQSIYKDFNNLETLWEYFIVFNKDGFDTHRFFKTYEKLQIVKEFCDLKYNKKVSGAGEGVAVTLSCKINDIPISKDLRLETLTINTLKPITRHTPPKEVPNHLK
jgi:hypothetical protein